MANDTKVFRPGTFLAGQTFKLDDKFFYYQSAYGRRSTVPRNSIEAVTVDARGAGKAALKLVGKGTTLAEIALPSIWAEKTQRWLLEELAL